MRPLRKIVIVGGGTSGWLAAAVLSSHLKKDLYQIELVESEEMGTIGIGESTIPPFVRLLQKIGIDEQEFINETQGCYKLGIKFVDWQRKDSSYFHPFGVVGKRVGPYDFYQCWLKARSHGNTDALYAFSPCAVMAENGRFFPPQGAHNTPIGGANYAVHLDAKLVARYFRNFSESNGVKRTEGKVQEVRQRDNGFIERVVLASGESVSGDFFIDCTGFNALMIDKTLGVGVEDWSQYLPCDRAIAVKTESANVRTPYTTATARDSGWGWRIPLRERTGHGYVYSSQFCSDAQAKSTLLKNLDSKRISDPHVIPFSTGRRKEIWKYNCLSLGLAAGFVEPLESTAIHLTARGLDFFLRFFPDRDCESSLIREYNRRMSLDYEEVRDFIILHYCTTQRDDTSFWRWCKNMTLPDSLQEKIELFKGHGIVREGVDDLFRSASWQWVFEGMGVRPAKYCPRVDNLDLQDINNHLGKAKAAILAMVKTLPTHDDYLRSLQPSGSEL